MTAQDWSDSITPEEWAAQRQANLRACLVPRGDLSKIPAPVPLIEHWLTMASLNWLFGDRGSFKSFIAIDFAGSVGTGLDWHGNAVKQAPVLYVALEGASGLEQRVAAWEDWAGQPMTGVHFLVPRSLQIVKDVTPLAGLVAELQAGLVIIDTQNRATVGLEENSSVDMGLMIAAMDQVQQVTGACVVTVHHVGSGSHRPRGHTSIDAAAQAMIRVSCDGGLVKVSNEKQKDGPRAGALILNATPRLSSVVLTADSGLVMTDTMRTLMAALRNICATEGTATHAQVKQACTSQDMPSATFNWALRQCKERGLAEKVNGKWRAVDQRQGKLLEVASPSSAAVPGSNGQSGWTPEPDPTVTSSWEPGTHGEAAQV